MARIVTVYTDLKQPFVPVDMSLIRWLKMSEALARLGHHVDMATSEPGLRGAFPRRLSARLRRIPLHRVRWDRYDVVKTCFHRGFATLESLGNSNHPFIISKLGSVVGDADQEGVFFYGKEREGLFRIQQRIAARARYVAILTEQSRELWRRHHGTRGNELLVPGAVDADIPQPGPSPYPRDEVVCVFAGNFYDTWSQPEAHRIVVDKLNRLGRALGRRGLRLHVVGRGDASRLDSAAVTSHGPVPYERSWDYLYHASVGVVPVFGSEPNQNESTKIYHYLRVGLPTVCEAGYPNENLVEEVSLGHVVANGDVEAMADAVHRSTLDEWDRGRAVDQILAEHTWDARARIYDALIRES